MNSTSKQSSSLGTDGASDGRRAKPQPVDSADRIPSVDVLRGVAILGMLVVNIWVMALPEPAYVDVAAKGGNAQLNLVTWVITELVFEGKMRAILSMLFGAGVILLTSRIEASGGESDVTDIYYRRIIWLLAMGVSQAFLLIWAFDFVYVFALIGLVLFPFRKMRAETLIVIGLLLLAVLVPKRILQSNNLRTMQTAAAKADVALAKVNDDTSSGDRATTDQGTATKPKNQSSESERSKASENEEPKDQDKLLRKHRQAKKQWNAKLKLFRPTPDQVQERLDLHRSGYWKLLKETVPTIVSFQSVYFYHWFFWDVAGMMFIGMGLMKLDVFSARRPANVYVLLAAGGYGIGFPTSVYLAYSVLAHKFDLPEMFLSCVVYDAARLAVSLGHVGLIMLVCKGCLWQWLISSLAAVGRMALTNYVSQIVICTLLFYGYGLGLYGRPERWHTAVLAITIWFLQLIVSTYWLTFFRFGPVEWIWRSLTYLQWQPMLLARTEPRATH